MASRLLTVILGLSIWSGIGSVSLWAADGPAGRPNVILCMTDDKY
jgi:hypothetical protein